MKVLLTTLFLISTFFICHAGEVSVGVVSGITQSTYRGQSVRYLPLPAVSYDSDKFYIKVPSVGYHIYKNEMFSVDAELLWMFQNYRASKNDHSDMKRLKNRHSSLGAGISSELKTQYGILNVNLTSDIINQSRGIIITARYSYPVIISQQFIVSPYIGAVWANSSYNNYYYSVSRNESARSGMPHYRTSDGFSPVAGVSTFYAFTPKLKAFLGTNYTFLSSEIKDSPMVSRSGIWSLFGGVMYSF